MKKPKILFFDVGGVCLSNGWDEKSRRKAAKHFSFAFEEMERRHKPVFGPFEKGKISLNDYLSKILFYKKQPFSRDEFIRFMKAESKAHETTLKLLGPLKRKSGCLLATLNNEPLELNCFRIEKFGLRDYFSFFLSSCFLGVRKPEPEIFERALQLTQCVPEECLFIDDRLENVKAARALGLRTIHLKEVPELAAELKARGIECQ